MVRRSPPSVPGWFAALPLNGQVNLLTSTSFDRPADLLALDGAPRSVTYLALSAPTGAGDWAMRGAMTQGDLASWIVSGSYLRRAPAACFGHAQPVGMYRRDRRAVGQTHAQRFCNTGHGAGSAHHRAGPSGRGEIAFHFVDAGRVDAARTVARPEPAAIGTGA